MIVAGGGVRASGAARELVALAEALQIPVVTSLNGKDSIPGNHPLSCGVVGTYSRESANKVVNAADLVCFVGTTTGGMTTHFWAVPKIGTPAIQIDIDPEALGLNYPLQARVNGDAKVTLGEDAGGRRQVQRRQAQGLGRAGAGHLSRSGTPSTSRCWSRTRCRSIRRASATSCRSTCRTTPSSWSTPATPACGWAACTTCAPPTQSYMRSAGHLGWAFPAGLGAKCGAPDRPVVTFTGDAGFWYHIGDIETAVRWKINAVTVVNNNGGGNQSKRGFDRVYGGTQTEQARELWTFRKTNFARIAEEMGALGIRVEDPKALPAALAQALAANRPVIIDVVTDIEALAPTAVT